MMCQLGKDSVRLRRFFMETELIYFSDYQTTGGEGPHGYWQSAKNESTREVGNMLLPWEYVDVELVEPLYSSCLAWTLHRTTEMTVIQFRVWMRTS